MSKKLKAEIAISLNATINQVWDALTNPEKIKKYMFGTETITDWKKGSTITYKGIWNEKPYEDKGIIEEIIPQKLLHTTFFSKMSGKEDTPENYANIIYEVKGEQDKTVLTVSQDNIDDEAQLEYMKKSWSGILVNFKKQVEN